MTRPGAAGTRATARTRFAGIAIDTLCAEGNTHPV